MSRAASWAIARPLHSRVRQPGPRCIAIAEPCAPTLPIARNQLNPAFRASFHRGAREEQWKIVAAQPHLRKILIVRVSRVPRLTGIVDSPRIVPIAHVQDQAERWSIRQTEVGAPVTGLLRRIVAARCRKRPRLKLDTQVGDGVGKWMLRY